MANRKSNTGTRTTKASVRMSKRPGKTRRPKSGSPSRTRTFVLPLFLSLSILVCLCALGILGYQTVTASDFFDVAKIEVRGTERASENDIRRVVEMQTEKSGVWNADLPAIKDKLERLTFIKSAAVSRVLPNGIRVQVFERVPEALVRTSQGNMLVDAEGLIIAPAREKEPALPFAMTGWNEAKSEIASKENLERLKMYQKMLTEWQEYNLSSRVLVVDMEQPREPRAFVEDSGTVVSIALVKDKFGDSLKRGINAIVGKGDMFEAVNLVGQNMILAPRKTK